MIKEGKESSDSRSSIKKVILELLDSYCCEDDGLPDNNESDHRMNITTSHTPLSGGWDSIEPYKFPYEEYRIIGDPVEIDKVINTCGFINIEVDDVRTALSKEKVNYVSTGVAEGTECIVNAFKIALKKIPLKTDDIYNMLIQVWLRRDMATMKECDSIAKLISKLSTNINVCCGFAIDESLTAQQAKITLIISGK